MFSNESLLIFGAPALYVNPFAVFEVANWGQPWPVSESTHTHKHCMSTVRSIIYKHTHAHTQAFLSLCGPSIDTEVYAGN